MKSFLKGALQYLSVILVDVFFAGLACYIFSYSLKLSLEIEIEWYKLLVLFYGVLAVLYRFKKELE